MCWEFRSPGSLSKRLISSINNWTSRMWSIKFDAGESGVDDVFRVTGDGGTGVGFTRYGFECGVGRLRGVGR